jgi:hypothetical protein
MVDDSAQLYTMEGIAAALIILATAYLVAGTTSVYTPGDSHITDMQLEVLGNDVLAVMDTPVSADAKSNLTEYITAWNSSGFNAEFGRLLNKKIDRTDNLQFTTEVSYRNTSGVVTTNDFGTPATGSGYEQAVRVTRLVTIPDTPTGSKPADFRTSKQVVMVEVLIWRG